jgi:hypothetical protein
MVRIRIRDSSLSVFYPWMLDRKKSRSEIRNEQPGSCFLELRNSDPRWKNVGSVINIPDPQHWLKIRKKLKIYFCFTIYPVPHNLLQRIIKFLPSALVDPPSTEATQGQGHTHSRLVLKGNILNQRPIWIPIHFASKRDIYLTLKRKIKLALLWIKVVYHFLNRILYHLKKIYIRISIRKR